MLSASPGWNEEPPPFAPGELLIGFEGEIATVFQTEDTQTALELAQRILAEEQLHTGRVLIDLPPQAGQGGRVVTHWQLSESADVEEVARRLSQLPGVSYAEPNFTMQMKSAPNDPGFYGGLGVWPAGTPDHDRCPRCLGCYHGRSECRGGRRRLGRRPGSPGPG